MRRSVPDRPVFAQRDSRARGFTLVEVILAIGIVALAGGLLLTSLAQSVRSAGKSRSRDSAIQLKEAVSPRLRDFEFEELYDLLRDQEAVFYAYSYRADPLQLRDDGTATPGQDGNSAMSVGFRHRSDPLLEEDLAAAEGDVFRLRLRPFLNDSGTVYSLPELENYPLPSLRVFVEFYQDYIPRENESDWPADRKSLSFPVSVSR